WSYISQWFELVTLSRTLERDRAGIEIYCHDITGLQDIAKSLGAFTRIKFAHGDAVAKENSGKSLRQHDPASGRTERDGRMLAGTAAPEVAATDDDWIIAVQMSFLHVASLIKRFRQTRKRIGPQLF